MRIIKDLEGVCLKNTVVTTGNFDGVHLGHRFLIEKLVALAKEKNGESVVIMFYPHPREVLTPDAGDFRYLSSPERNCDIFKEYGIDIVVQIRFTKELASWSEEGFIKNILIDKLSMTTFLVGYDHRLGNPRKRSDLNVLSQKYGFEMQQCLPYKTESGIVSSSAIRDNLIEGNVKSASHLLGRLYAMRCQVIEGAKVGRSIGFPTANLRPVFEKHLIPAEGVYAVKVKFRGHNYGGMLQVGHRPTLNDGRGLTIEVHIFDFEDNIYEEIIDVCFVAYMRENKRFESVEVLRQCLEADAVKAKTLCSM